MKPETQRKYIHWVSGSNEGFKIKSFLKTMLMVIVLLSGAISQSISAHGEGGFFLRILPDPSNEWSNNSKLWIVAEPGANSVRRFTVANTSSRSIDVDLKLGGARIIDGTISYDKDATLRSQGYASFSENPVNLAPNEQKVIEVAFSAPREAESFAEDGYLLASVAGKDVTARDGLQIVIPTVYQYAYPMFVGVGSYAEFRSDFEILDVDGYINSSGNALRVFLKNTGKIPILLKGDVSFQDSTFGGPVLGPFDFNTSRISPGQTAFVAVQLPETITETKWKIFTKASVGINTKTKIFEKNLSFTGISLFTRAIQLFLALISIFGLLWSWRQFRPSKRGLDQQISDEPKRRSWSRVRKPTPQNVDEFDFDAEALISKLMDDIRTESDKALSTGKVRVATQRKPVKKAVSPGGKVVKGSKK
jgi:hypothetical protein